MARDCPRAKSAMTPCYLRDGDVVIVEGFRGREICVGCEASIEKIRHSENLDAIAARRTDTEGGEDE